MGSMKSASEPKKCSKCGKMAERHAPNSVSGGFSLSATSTDPQNTGVHDFDTNPDRVIGSSAEQGWDICEERQRDKLKFIADNNVTGYDVARVPDGTYRVMTEKERAFKESERLKSEAYSKQTRSAILAERMKKPSA